MRELLGRAIDFLQEKFPPNRVVVLLTPLVFVPASGFVSAWVAKNLPGVNLDSTWLLATFVAGGLSAAAAANKWLDGWQKHERILADPSLDSPPRLPAARVAPGRPMQGGNVR